MSELFILGVLYAKPGREQETREVLTALVAPSKNEGNLRFELYAHQDDPRRFVLLEQWASPAAQHQHHTQTEHIRQFKEHGEDAIERHEVFYKLDRIA